MVHATGRSHAVAALRGHGLNRLLILNAAVFRVRLVRSGDFELFWGLALVCVEVVLRDDVASQLSMGRTWMHLAVEGKLEHRLFVCHLRGLCDRLLCLCCLCLL